MRQAVARIVRERRLRDRRRNVRDGDRVGLERTRWILADCATAKRDDRGERIIQRTGHRSLVRATASHDEVLVKRVTRDAKALLQIGYLRLRLERALRRVNDREYAAGGDE